MAAEVDYSGKIEPKILEKYKIMKCLGKGSYGIVWKGMHKLTGDIWAIKKNFDAFRNSTDAQRTYREITILRELHNHPNIIKLQDVIQAKGNKDIYLIFDCMDTDLHAVIKKRSILHDVHKRYILYQILKATKYIHSGNVIHRDLKPSNILLDSQCSVRLCDFGLARSLGQIEDEHCGLTQYVVTRWYRAPEIFLGCQYTKGVDMWSVGCILGEMLLGKALFPGTSAIHQMELIQRVTEPSKQDIDEVDKVFGRILSATKSYWKRCSPGNSLAPLSKPFTGGSYIHTDTKAPPLASISLLRDLAGEVKVFRSCPDLHAGSKLSNCSQLYFCRNCIYLTCASLGRLSVLIFHTCIEWSSISCRDILRPCCSLSFLPGGFVFSQRSIVVLLLSFSRFFPSLFTPILPCLKY
uniref:extracellular signal-regulated kinase 2-like isoform X3 n=1 Tax=Myxine glutinosa TaxID=7769 RepID=UPI00358ED497